MWLLKLNPIDRRHECLIAVAKAETKEKLEQYIAGEKADEEWVTKAFHLGIPDYEFVHYFKKGSRLENFNAPDDRAYEEIINKEEYLQRIYEHYSERYDELTNVPKV